MKLPGHLVVAAEQHVRLAQAGERPGVARPDAVHQRAQRLGELVQPGDQPGDPPVARRVVPLHRALRLQRRPQAALNLDQAIQVPNPPARRQHRPHALLQRHGQARPRPADCPAPPRAALSAGSSCTTASVASSPGAGGATAATAGAATAGATVPAAHRPGCCQRPPAP